MAEQIQAGWLRIEVVYANPERQWQGELVLAAGSTVRQALQAAMAASLIPDEAIDPARLGIFGRRASADTVLTDGDRIEIYRPLRLDPKEARRRRAQS